jgi:hypothetical protein
MVEDRDNLVFRIREMQANTDSGFCNKYLYLRYRSNLVEIMPFEPKALYTQEMLRAH